MTAGGSGSRDCLISISTGTANVNGNITMLGSADRNYISFSSNGFLNISGEFMSAGGLTLSGTSTINYNNAGTQNIKNFIYDNLQLSNSGVKSLTANLTVNKDIIISGTAQLETTTTSYNISIAGNWNVSSTNGNPFIENTSRVTFNGSLNSQSITTVLSGGETFYNATINNSFATSPQLTTNENINITNDIDWTAGALDLLGNNFNVTGGTTTSALNNGTIITTIAGSSITITDPTDTYTVDLSNFTVGTNTTTGAISFSMTSNSSTWRGCKFFGNTYFTKTGSGIDDFAGGNIFYGPSCYFKTTATAARWRMGNNNPAPDIYYNATFEANGKGGTNNNFIVGANSIGNEYYGTTNIISTTSGGFFVGRNNGTGNNSHVFYGPIIINVADSGNVTIGDADATNTSNVIIENTIQLNSLSSSIGDIIIGSRTGLSALTFTNNAQIIDGSILGATNIYFNSINQFNTLPNSTSSGALTNSTIFVGQLSTSAATTCTFNGNVSFIFPNINLRGGIFNGTNSFQANGTSGLTGYGGNIFNGTTTFINNGTGYWRLANNVADDYNANVTFRRLSTGDLVPAYNTNCTFSRNISTTGTSSPVTFCGGTTNGTVTIDGNGSQTLSGSSTNIPVIRNLVMNTTSSGSLTLNVPLQISSSLVMTNGNVISSASNSITLTDENVTSNLGNVNSFVSGPLAYNITSTATNSLNFPIGKILDWRPVSLIETNSVNTSITYIAESFNSSARTFSWTVPPTVSHVSDKSYWDINRTLTSSGAALPTQSLTGTQTVTLFYIASDMVDDPTNLTICKNTSASPTTWVDVGGTGATAVSGSVTSTSAPSVFNSYSRFTLGNKIGGTNPLPIELIYFDATKNEQVVDLKWETATEINNDYFIVEKSLDGINFEPISQIKSFGNSNTNRKYNISDSNPYQGISYYRLNQIDYDKTNSYSNIRSVEFSNSITSGFDIYPNPTNNNIFNLNIYTDETYELLISIYDITGKVLLTQNIKPFENGITMCQIKLPSEVSSGVYIVKMRTLKESYFKKLILD